MADIDIANLRALEKQATPGPWTRAYHDLGNDTRPIVVADGYGFPAECEGDNDAALIAAARNALPELLDALEAERARLREMTARALGHAYTAGMAEGAEEILRQENELLQRELLAALKQCPTCEELTAVNADVCKRAEAAERERDELRAAVEVAREALDAYVEKRAIGNRLCGYVGHKAETPLPNCRCDWCTVNRARAALAKLPPPARSR